MAKNKKSANRKAASAASNSLRQKPQSGGQALSYARPTRTTAPRQRGSGRSVRVEHEELIATVTMGAVAEVFSATAFAINPGLAETFPWLSRIAQQYEKYKFHKLCFRYVTRSATTTEGSIIMAPDYDAADAPPTTEIIAASYKDAVEAPVWQSFEVVLEASSQGVKYVRSEAIPGTDIKTYDIANLFCGNVPSAGATDKVVGKLWVHYDVELMIPQIASVASPPVEIVYVQSAYGSQSLAGYEIPNAIVEHQLTCPDAYSGSGTLVPHDAATGIFGPVPEDGLYVVRFQVSVNGYGAVTNTNQRIDLRFYRGASAAIVTAGSNPVPGAFVAWAQTSEVNFQTYQTLNIAWLVDGSEAGNANRYFALKGAFGIGVPGAVVTFSSSYTLEKMG